MKVQSAVKLASLLVCVAPLCGDQNHMTESHMTENHWQKTKIDEQQTSMEGEFFGSGNVLYYYVTEDALNAGISYQSSTIVSGTEQELGGNFINLNFPWKPGFKLAFGYRDLSEKAWEAFVEYFQVNTNAATQASAAPGGVLRAGWLQHDINQLDPPESDFVSAQWTLGTYILDFLVGKTYEFQESATFRPVFGLRSAWINQAYTLLSLDSNSTANSINSGTDSRSWSIGFKTGIDTDWLIGKGFSFYGKAGGSILMTRYALSRSEVIVPSTPRYELYYRQNTGRINTDLSMGLGWQGELFKGAKMQLKMGYDFAVFFAQNFIRALADGGAQTNGDGSATGDLYMQGLDMQFGLSF